MTVEPVAAIAPIAAPDKKRLYQSVVDYLERYVIFPSSDHAMILALWVLHTHLFDAAHATPYVYLTSAEMQSGKSRLIDCLELLVREPLRTISISEAALYRKLENKPTVMIDEIDTVYAGGSGNELLRSVLNGGYRDGSSVIRMGFGAGGDEESFPTFSPKLLAGIDAGHLPGTVIDRSITIRLRRKLRNQQVERFIRRRVEPEAETLKHEIEAFARKNRAKLKEIYPEEITDLSDRAWEITEPLVAIAALIGKPLEKEARKGIVAVIKSEKEPVSEGTRILALIREYLGDKDKVPSSELAHITHLSAPRLANKLRPYEIKPMNINFGGGQILKGYYAEQFEDAFDRYL